jgi:hypothetical protein
MRNLASTKFLTLALSAALTLLTMSPASAIPVFAHRYGLSCQTCHTVVPHLTQFGRMFLANGYRIPGMKPKGAFPVAVRVESTYASAGAADPDESSGPLPKAIVDEVEAFVGGASGSRGSYWVENYFIDGGEQGHLREAWYANRLTPDGAKVPVVARAGQFTLPLPLDPETFRETTQPYLIWGQTAGNNPFSFFPAKAGVQAQIGDPGRALSGSVNFIQGREPGSGLQPNGVDKMLTLERDYGDWTLSAYRYQGTRELQGLGYGGTFQVSNVGDSFWRNGYAAGWNHGKTEANAVYQIGHDSSADLYHDSLMSSGGFVQVRRDLNGHSFALARWDATQDATQQRSLTAGIGIRPRSNMRVTLFETEQRDYLGNILHIISSAWLFAY